MKLSPHFTLGELTASPTAVARRIDNTAPPEVVARLRRVAVELLEPVRARFGRPLTINSGYRCLELNRAIGSSAASQHVRGEAVDFEIPGVPNGDIAIWCRDHLPTWGQLILENYRPGIPSSGWVHLSLPRIGKPNRMVLTATMGSHGMVYSTGIHL